MPTLTSTGNVNLTSATNWNLGLIPTDGDDLIIAAHTLTLDADLVLDSITFNAATSRLAISGTSRSIQATNGFIIGVNLSGALITAALPVGTSLTLTGRWSGTNLATICSSTGGNLTLQTVGADPSAVLFADVASGLISRIIINSWTSGTLTTIGRFDLPSWNTGNTLVAMASGTWNHTNTGTSLLGTGSHVILSTTGPVTLNWSGNLTSNSQGTGNLISIASGASTVNINNGSVIRRTGGGGGNHQSGQFANIFAVAASGNGSILNLDGVLCTAKT
jgi:hypothetical protein